MLPDNSLNCDNLIADSGGLSMFFLLVFFAKQTQWLSPFCPFPTFSDFTLSSFCANGADMATFSKLRMLRLDANKISAKDIPAEAAYCLRRVASIDV